jgi:hypothetical protein
MIREGESRCKEKTHENGLFFAVFYVRERNSTCGRYFWGTGAMAACADPFSPAARKTEQRTRFGVDFASHFRILEEELARAIAALPAALALVAEPRTPLLDHVAPDASVEQVALADVAWPVEDIELRFARWRRDFISNYLYSSPVADNAIAVLARRKAPDVRANRRIELQRPAAGRGFRAAEYHADLLPDRLVESRQLLIFETVSVNLRAPAASDTPAAHMAIAHFACALGLGHEPRNGINDYDSNRAGGHKRPPASSSACSPQSGCDTSWLSTSMPSLRAETGSRRVFGVDESRAGAVALCLGNRLQSDSLLAGRFRSEISTARHTPHVKGRVK